MVVLHGRALAWILPHDTVTLGKSVTVSQPQACLWNLGLASHFHYKFPPGGSTTACCLPSPADSASPPPHPRSLPPSTPGPGAPAQRALLAPCQLVSDPKFGPFTETKVCGGGRARVRAVSGEAASPLDWCCEKQAGSGGLRAMLDLVIGLGTSFDPYRPWFSYLATKFHVC